MTTAFFIWLYLALEDLLGTACIISGSVWLLALAANAIEEDQEDEKPGTRKVLSKWWIPSIFIVLVCLLPTRDDIQYITGGAVLVEAVQFTGDIPGIQKLPENLVQAANTFLEGTKDQTEAK